MMKSSVVVRKVDRILKCMLISIVVALIANGPAAAQLTTTIFFDGAEVGIPNGAADFSYMGSNWTGGLVTSLGFLPFYASGLRSFHVYTVGSATITFDEPMDVVTFFFVHGTDPGTATAYDDLPDGSATVVGTASSSAATVFNDPNNFVTIDPIEPIDRIVITDGIIDNFTYTTISIAPVPLDDPIPEPITRGKHFVTLEVFTSGLVSPLGIKFPNDSSGRAFVYDQVGRILTVEGGVITGTLLDVTGRIVTLQTTFDERGLIGLAIHPDFAINGLIYTYTSEPVSGPADFTVALSNPPFNHQSVIAEWQVVGSAVDMGTRRELFRFDEPQFNHNAGAMEFGPDGFLYIAIGDGGGADDDGDGHGIIGNGQDTNTILGSLVRIDPQVDTGDIPSANGQYAIPADNPFVGVSGLDEIYAYGLRNPYQFSFDQLTGELWLADVGQNDIEELDLVFNGGNYGWNVKEGSFVFDPNGTGNGFVTHQEIIPGLIDPFAEYDHDEGTSIIGGFVYRGADPDLYGIYLAGDFTTSFISPSGRLFYLDEVNFSKPTFRELNIGLTGEPLGIFVKGFAQDPEGNVYVCGSTQLAPVGTDGVILKLVPIPALLGDVNGDGAVTPGDAQEAFNLFLGISTPLFPSNGDVCPVGGDGAVTPGDAQGIFNLFLGLPTPCE